jgi:hypothetical protein
MRLKGVSFVSNYDEKIRNAFDKIEPPTDDESFIRGIIERADNMEKEKGIIRTEQKRFVEITVPRVERKPSRAPWIIGAAALTAAAVGIGFIAGGHFGPGKDIKTSPANGAGYSGSQAAETSVSHVPHIPEASLDGFDNINYYTEADEFYEFENVSVRVTGYYFDGISLTLYYDVISKADTFDRDDPDNYLQLRPVDEVSFAAEYSITSVDGNTAHFVMTGRLYSRTRDLDLYFGTRTKRDDGKYDITFMLDNDKMFPVECSDMAFLLAYEDAKSTVSYAKFCNVYVSPLGYVITYPGKDMAGSGDGTEPDHVPDVKIELSDGTNAQIAGMPEEHFGADFGYVAGKFIEKCDTRMIKNIIVDDTVIYSAPDSGMASDGVASAADDPSMYEFRDYSVRIKSLTFSDGMLCAEYDVIYPEGIPTSDSESGEPRVLPCPAENIWSLEREVPGMEISRSMASDSRTMHYHVSFMYNSFSGDAHIVFYDTKHFAYSNDIPYYMTYSVPITVVGEKGYYGAVTSAVVTTAPAPAVTVETTAIEHIAEPIGSTGITVIPTACLYDGNIVLVELKMSGNTEKELPDNIGFSIAPKQNGQIQTGWGHTPTQLCRKTADDRIMLYAYLPVPDGSRQDIAVTYSGNDDSGESEPYEMFSFTVYGTSAEISDVRADTVGVDLGKAGFGPEGLRYDGLTVSDYGVVFTFSSDSSTGANPDLKITAKDRDGNVYDLAKNGYASQDIGSGIFIYEVLVIPDDLGDKKLTDMKLISVNGLEVLLCEMSRPEQPELTTVTWINDEPLSEVSAEFAETDTTTVPTA